MTLRLLALGSAYKKWEIMKKIYRYLCQRVPLVGSNANNSSKAGTFSLNVNNTWTNDNANIGTQLCLLITKLWHKYLGTRQNTKQTSLRVGRLNLEGSEAT